MLNWKFCADDVLMHCPPHLLAYLHFLRKTAGVEGMRIFPIFVLLERQERGFFFNFHHRPSLKIPAANKIWPGEYNWLCFSITIRKAKFIFTPKIAEIFSMFKCYISVGLNLAYHLRAEEIGLITKPVRFILPALGRRAKTVKRRWKNKWKLKRAMKGFIQTFYVRLKAAVKTKYWTN